MADTPRTARTPASRKRSTSSKAQAKDAAAAPRETLSGPHVSLQGFINWMNVVDDFALAGQKNILPRWGFVMAVLLYLAVS